MAKKITRILLVFLWCFATVLYAQSAIVLRIVLVNPSKEEAQIVPVKVYLPKEVKSQDVLNKGDLDIAYDSQQGSYYVYGEYDLKPSEVMDKEIELRDIWQISASEIESLRFEANQTNKMLEDTELAQRAQFLTGSIVKKLDRIAGYQKSNSSNPQEHISQYRRNLELLEVVKSDLTTARSMLDKAKPLSTVAIWKIMIFILLFLTVLSLSFYMFWHRQLKNIASPIAQEDDKPTE